MSRLDEIRARLDAATPGPWEKQHSDGLAYVRVNPRLDIARAAKDWAVPDERDADLIAHAPEDLRLLLNAVDALRAIANGDYVTAPLPPYDGQDHGIVYVERLSPRDIARRALRALDEEPA